MGAFDSDVEKWTPVALGLPGGDKLELSIPRHVLLAEAVDVAKFAKKYWAPKIEGGAVVWPGLMSVAGKKKQPDELSADTAENILSLGRAATEAHTRYILALEVAAKSPFEHGQFLLDELSETLEFWADDGVEDNTDVQLAKLSEAHPDDPATADALASALEDYAGLADAHRATLDGVGGFEATTIDKARTLAGELRDRPPVAEVLTEKASAALKLRNLFLLLLLKEMKTVRSAARFVFRRNPEIVREATSAYGRRQRAEAARKAAKAKKDEGKTEG